MKYALLITLIFLTSCTWTSDDGWGVATPTPSIERSKEYFACVGENEFGKYVEGGGCNAYGCWPEGGSCNEFGCSVDSNCTALSCPKKIASINCNEGSSY